MDMQVGSQVEREEGTGSASYVSCLAKASVCVQVCVDNIWAAVHWRVSQGIKEWSYTAPCWTTAALQGLVT